MLPCDKNNTGKISEERNRNSLEDQSKFSDSYRNRNTWIICDSTLNNVDKRKIGSNNVASKSKASTIDESIELIETSRFSRKHIVFSVGTNDIKEGSAEDVIDRIETLIECTKAKHKGVHIHVCSILPVEKESATKVNKHIQLSICKGDRFIHYIDTAKVCSHYIIHPDKFSSRKIEEAINVSIAHADDKYRRFSREDRNRSYDRNFPPMRRNEPVRTQYNNLQNRNQVLNRRSENLQSPNNVKPSGVWGNTDFSDENKIAINFLGSLLNLLITLSQE